LAVKPALSALKIMARWFWALSFALVSESARVVKNANGDLPVYPPGYEDPNVKKAPDPVEQADGKVVQSVSWDVAEDFNLARAKARERREARMAEQQAAAAKAQEEAEAKVKAAWEKNSKKNVKAKPKAPEPSSTTLHLIRKPRPHVHRNRTANHTTNQTHGNASALEKPDPALDGLDHIADKVAHFGDVLEKFSKAQAGKGKKAKKLPPQVAKIMENAEELMKKIIAVADDKSIEAPEIDTKKVSNATDAKSNSTSLVKHEGKASSNQSVSIGKNTTNTTVASKTSGIATPNSTASKNTTVAVQPSNKTDAVVSQAVSNNVTAVAIVDSKNGTLATNTSTKNSTLAASKNATNVVSSSSQNVTQTMSKNAGLKNATVVASNGSLPATNTTTTMVIANQTIAANRTGALHTTQNATQNASTRTKHAVPRETPTHFNKPDRMVHSALGAARLAAAKLRGMRVHLHKPEVADDSWKLANAEIDSRIEGLKSARDDARKADDQDLAESLQEKINGLQAEAKENKANSEKVKTKHHSSQ